MPHHLHFLLKLLELEGLQLERLLMIFTLTALSLAPRCNRRPRQPKLPHQDRTRYDDISIQIPGWDHCSDGLQSDGGQLDCKSDGQEGH